jgi:hypothetical protein
LFLKGSCEWRGWKKVKGGKDGKKEYELMHKKTE